MALAGASSSRMIRVAAPSVYREVAARQYSLLQRVPPEGRLRCLSGLTGDCHEPFLGGWGASNGPLATRP